MEHANFSTNFSARLERRFKCKSIILADESYNELSDPNRLSYTPGPNKAPREARLRERERGGGGGFVTNSRSGWLVQSVDYQRFLSKCAKTLSTVGSTSTSVFQDWRSSSKNITETGNMFSGPIGHTLTTKEVTL